MFREIDAIKHLLQSGDQLFRQISELWDQGPRAEVYQQGNKVKVVVEAPGLLQTNNPNQWAFRVLDQNLYLRRHMDMEDSVRSDFGQIYGQRSSEQFTKMIPLPVPVHRKPSSVEYEDGLITIWLDKARGPVNDDWQVLDFSNRKRLGR